MTGLTLPSSDEMGFFNTGSFAAMRRPVSAPSPSGAIACARVSSHSDPASGGNMPGRPLPSAWWQGATVSGTGCSCGQA